MVVTLTSFESESLQHHHEPLYSLVYLHPTPPNGRYKPVPISHIPSPLSPRSIPTSPHMRPAPCVPSYLQVQRRPPPAPFSPDPPPRDRLKVLSGLTRWSVLSSMMPSRSRGILFPYLPMQRRKSVGGVRGDGDGEEGSDAGAGVEVDARSSEDLRWEYWFTMQRYQAHGMV